MKKNKIILSNIISKRKILTGHGDGLPRAFGAKHMTQFTFGAWEAQNPYKLCKGKCK